MSGSESKCLYATMAKECKRLHSSKVPRICSPAILLLADISPVAQFCASAPFTRAIAAPSDESRHSAVSPPLFLRRHKRHACRAARISYAAPRQRCRLDAAAATAAECRRESFMPRPSRRFSFDMLTPDYFAGVLGTRHEGSFA